MHITTQTEISSGTGQEEYFLPDLCAPLPSLLTILSVELLVLVYVLAVSIPPYFRWDLFSHASLFVQLIVLLSAWSLCVTRPRFSKLSLPIATVASLVLVSLHTLLVSLFVQAYLAEIIDLTASPWWILRNLVIANLLAAMLLRYFYLQQQLRLRDQWALKARLDSLSERMRPHFLFNTLNSIASLISSRPDIAEQAVEDLAELLRASLRKHPGQTTVEDELQLTARYLDIEALGLGARLTVDWDIDDLVRNAPMPSLIIQPLAENAIKHGIALLPEGGHIQIRIGGNSQRVRVSVINPVGPVSTDSAGNQIAFANIEQRLQAIYGASVSVQSLCENQVYRVDIMYSTGQNVI